MPSNLESYSLTDDQIKEVYVPLSLKHNPRSRRKLWLTFWNRTAKIKQMGDIRPRTVDDADSVIHLYNINLQQQESLPQESLQPKKVA
jgi:hypothetical protein